MSGTLMGRIFDVCDEQEIDAGYLSSSIVCQWRALYDANVNHTEARDRRQTKTQHAR